MINRVLQWKIPPLHCPKQEKRIYQEKPFQVYFSRLRTGELATGFLTIGSGREMCTLGSFCHPLLSISAADLGLSAYVTILQSREMEKKNILGHFLWVLRASSSNGRIKAMGSE